MKRGLKGKIFGPYIECSKCHCWTNHTDIEGESIGLCTACDPNYDQSTRQYVGDNMNEEEDIDTLIAEFRESEPKPKENNVIQFPKKRGRPKGSKNKK